MTDVQKTSVVEQKVKQRRFFDEVEDPEFETTRPEGAGKLYQYLMEYKFGSAISALPFSLRGKKVLNVCCGSGMDAQFLAREGAAVTALDISEGAVHRMLDRSRRFPFAVEGMVGDAEHLPFKDRSFDVAFVHDGLHHLPAPHSGIREMCRVTKSTVVVIEPANAWVTKIAMKIGLAETYEEAGNFVYRFSRTELRTLLGGEDFDMTTFGRFFMYYHHQPTHWYRIFDNRILLSVFRGIFGFLNAVIGFFGNKMYCVAIRLNRSQ